MSTTRALLDESLVTLQSPDRFRRQARVGHAILAPCVVLMWLVSLFLHGMLPVDDVRVVHVIAVVFLAEIAFFWKLTKTTYYTRTIYLFNFVVDMVLIFCFIAGTGATFSPFLFAPVLYLVGNFFIHGFIQAVWVLFLSFAGLALPLVLGAAKPGLPLTVAMLLLVLLTIVFMPIWVLHLNELQGARKALQESEKKYRDLAEALPQTLFEMDMSGMLTYANETGMKMFGVTPEAFARGVKVPDFIAPEDRERLAVNIRKAMYDGAETSYEYTAARPDGSRFPIVVYSNVVLKDGHPAGFRGIAVDVTEQKLAESRIRELNEDLDRKVRERTQQLLAAQEDLIRKEKLALLGRIAGSVGHELRNPLGVMSNAIYYLQTVLSNADENVREYLGIIKSEITGAERIVSDLLDAVRANPPRPRSIPPGDLIQISLEKCKIPDKVKVDVAMKTYQPVLVDPIQMQQVFINLISNAVDAMPEGGVLRIGARRVQSSEYKVQSAQSLVSEPSTQNLELRGSFVEMSVADTGCGISSESMKNLFQPLYTTKARGIGLGLVVVKNLTEANGGRVSVASEAGKGTSFTILLPSGEA